MAKSIEEVVYSFIERINNADFLGVTALLSPDHQFFDLQGEKHQGLDTMAEGWRNYLTENPDYQIYIRNIYKSESKVILVGHTTCSHLNLPELVEFHSEGMIWNARVAEGKIKKWQILEDTQENYNQLGLNECEKVFNPTLYSRTIAKHLDLLPLESRTQDVRNVRKFYSRLYRDYKAEDILLLAEKLLFEEGYRLVPYELIYHHPGAIEILTPDRVIALGKSINDWSSTDIFARFIAGPAWKRGVIADSHIDAWINSKCIWWRRAAVVSTIYLEGDVDKMLRYTKLLLNDREDLIIKALSWVLRSAIKYNKNAVIDFINTNEDCLAARIKREVNNKLETGLKYP